MLPLWSFQGARGPAPAEHEMNRLRGRSLKTQQRLNVEVDVVPGEPGSRTAEAIDEPDAYGVRAPYSLERR